LTYLSFIPFNSPVSLRWRPLARDTRFSSPQSHPTFTHCSPFRTHRHHLASAMNNPITVDQLPQEHLTNPVYNPMYVTQSDKAWAQRYPAIRKLVVRTTIDEDSCTTANFDRAFLLLDNDDTVLRASVEARRPNDRTRIRPHNEAGGNLKYTMPWEGNRRIRLEDLVYSAVSILGKGVELQRQPRDFEDKTDLPRSTDAPTKRIRSPPSWHFSRYRAYPLQPTENTALPPNPTIAITIIATITFYRT